MGSKEIPLSKGLPLLGHLLDYKKDRLEMLSKVRQTYGEIFKLKVGPKTLVVITKPDQIEHVLQKNSDIYIKKTNADQLFGQSIGTANGEEWKTQRSLIQPLLNPRYFASIFDDIKSIAKKNIDDYYKNQNDGVDLKNLFAKITYDIILKTIIGLDCYERFQEVDNAIQEMTDFISNDKYSFINLPESLDKKKKLFKKSLKALDDIIYEGIEKAKKGENSRSLVSVLVQAVEKSEEIKDKNQFIRDNVFTLLYAGYDTSALTLSWLSYELSRNQEWVLRCQEELSEFNYQELEYQQIKSMPIIESCISESMRLYPPGWAFTRFATLDDHLCGYKINKGDIILYSPYLTHRDPDIWNAPLEFNPSRFSEEESKKRNRFSFVPFGAGPRTCTGMNFGLMEIKVILTYLLQNYTIEQSGEDPVMDARVTLFSKNNFQLKLIKRKSE